MARRYLPGMLAALLGSLILAGTFGQMEARFQAFQLRIGATVSPRGVTEIRVPPIGLVRARTHLTPVKLEIALENIDLGALQEMLKESPAKQQIMAEAETALREAAKHLLLKLLLLGAVGGAMGMLLLHRKNIFPYLRGAVLGTALVAALAAGTGATYNSGAFFNPQYEGLLKAAPWMIGLAEEALGKVETLGGQMQVMARNFSQLFAQVDGLVPLEAGEGDLKVLHVSDIHNNPAGYDLIAKVAQDFQVDLIVDTGDITDYGTPLENLITERLKGLKIPYLYVAGNHDSPATIKALQGIPGVTVLDGRVVEVKGLKVLGFADPVSRTADIAPLPESELEDYAVGLYARLKELKQQPDVLAIHNQRLARELAGAAPVLLFGHDHRYSIQELNGSVLVDAGSTGAAGVRGLLSNEVPYSLVLLHFQITNGKASLVAADTIRVYNLSSNFVLERRTFPTEGKKNPEAKSRAGIKPAVAKNQP